jgi:hypothetical protein
MLVAGWRLGFYFRILGFGGGGNRFEAAGNWFRVVGRVVSFESSLGLVWVGYGVPWVVRGGLSSICVSVCVPGCALCELSAMVLVGFVCVLGWPLCFFGGGRTGDVVSVSLSRVRVCGPLV